MSTYSDEGTIAHALAAMCLIEDNDASAYLGRTIKSQDYEHAGLSPSGAHRWMACVGSHALEAEEKFEEREFQMEVDEGMATDVQTYVDNIRRYRDNGGQPGVLYIEQEVPVSHVTEEHGATGTADAVILLPGEMQMHDLKFGRGRAVSPDENKQMLLYASGCVVRFYPGETLPDDFSIRLVIHQPRLIDAPLEWACTYAHLKAFEVVANAQAHAVHVVKEQGLPLSLDGDGGYLNLKPGEEQCQWCSAKATCPALAKKVTETVGADFEVLTVKSKEDKVPAVISHLPLIDHALLGQKMAATDLIEMWVKAVRGRVEGELLAHQNDPDVCLALNHKLVKGRMGSRSWLEEEQAEKTLKAMRLKTEQIYTLKVITPTKAEEMFMPKAKNALQQPKRWEKLKALIGQKEGKPSVASLADKRDALVFKPTTADFDDERDNGDLG